MRQKSSTFAALWKAAVGLALMWGLSAPLAAQDSGGQAPEFDGLIELRAVESNLDFNEGEEIDSSGIGARARLGANFHLSPKTELRVEGEARIFEYRDNARDSLETLIGRVTLTSQLSDEVTVRAHARRFENIAVLEAFSADQTSIGGRIQWQRGNDRLRLNAEYREREYDTVVPGSGDGYQVSGQYNRRFGSYHWLRFDLRHEDMQSDNAPRRSYDRQVAQVKYSHPISKRVRLRPSLQYRQWDYDSRVARGDPQGAMRKDSYIAPALELSVGRATRGFSGVASVEYRIRSSNDERFDRDTVRVGVRLAYRF